MSEAPTPPPVAGRSSWWEAVRRPPPARDRQSGVKVVHATKSDGDGGAFRAAFRVHRALVDAGVDSRLEADRSVSGDWRVNAPTGRWSKGAGIARSRLEAAVVSAQHTRDRTMRSASVVPGSAARRLSAAEAEVVNLHWVADGLLSIRQIGHVDQPVVWTLHDMWAFCGAEHYAGSGPQSRWRVGYRRDNRPPDHRGVDIDRWTWHRKQRAWRRPFNLVTPSRWLATCARSSALLADWPVTVIPNPLPTDEFRPHPKPFAREALGLPPAVPLVLFGAMGGTTNTTKGWDLLVPALEEVARRLPGVEAAVFGESEPRHPPRLGVRVHWMGPLHDDVALAMLYSAADVMVVPSRREVLAQTGTEAQGAGTPVVAFNATGLVEVVDDRRTGYLAEAFDTSDLAFGIIWVLEDPERHRSLSVEARERALRLWSPNVVAPQYLEVYQHAVEAKAMANRS